MTGRTNRWFVIGLGRVGTTMARALNDHGLLSGAWTRSPESAERGRDARLPNVQQGSLPELPEADIVLVALPDGIIGRFVAALSAEVRQRESLVWLHASGALDREVLASTGVIGPCGSMHPLRSISSPDTPSEALRGTYFALEGDAGAVAAAKAFAERVGGEPHVLPPDSKRAYHAAATVASNGVYALLEAARGITERAGIGDEALGSALAALASQSARNAEALPLEAALTGPVVRGDTSTLLGHLAHLEAHNPELVPLYAQLSELLVGIAERSGRTPEHAVDALRAVLSSALLDPSVRS